MIVRLLRGRPCGSFLFVNMEFWSALVAVRGKTSGGGQMAGIVAAVGGFLQICARSNPFGNASISLISICPKTIMSVKSKCTPGAT